MKKLIILSACVIFLSGCASIIGGGGKQNVKFIPQDPDNTAKINVVSKKGSQELTLPATVKIKRTSKDIIVTVNDDCYKKNTQVVSSEINPFFWGNIISGGVVGSTTDSLTGAMWKYDENVIVYTTPNKTCEKK